METEYKPEPKKAELNLVLPAFTLDELLAQITDPPEPEIDWGAPVGDEVW